MFDFTNAQIERIAINYVGNKSRDEIIRFSKSELRVDETVKELLLKYFLSPFKSNQYYNLYHESALALNEVYSFVSTLFTDPDTLLAQAINISRHLYEQSNHPQIKAGEFYVIYFSGLVVDNEEVTATGLFKSENKETFLKVFPNGENFEINCDDGININKLDKGCLIFNTEKENGYKVAVVDNTNRSSEAMYWKDHFLKVIERQDAFHQTQNYMGLCKSFISKELNQNFDVTKADQIDLLNKSVSYFKDKTAFDIEDFSTEVIQQPEVIAAFKDYKEQFAAERHLTLEDEFDISNPAVKQQARIFKSVLKLDKNFHVYIHGKREYIEKGVDPVTGMNYYKLLYNNES
jgi:hypothetical protein